MNSECRKTGFKVGKHTFIPVSWQQCIRSTQKNLRRAKQKTVNVVKLVLKSANTCLYPYIGNVTTDRHKKSSNVLKKEAGML